MWLKANSSVIKIMLAIVLISAKYQSEEYESEGGAFSVVSGYIDNFFTCCAVEIEQSLSLLLKLDVDMVAR